jgi:hypothetical protein
MSEASAPASAAVHGPASALPAAAGGRTGFALAVGAAVALALFGTAFTTLNTDLGWMLDFGREAVRSGRLPAVNGRSFVEPAHPLILHEWATCLVFYLVHARWGGAGLIALRWMAAAATILVVAATVRRVTSSGPARLIALLIAAETLAAAGGLQLVRPQLASMVLLAAVVHLGLFGSARTLWWCLPLFALWANLHGAWVAGGAVLVVACSARGIEQRLGWRPRGVPDVILAGIPVFSVACVLLNPYGGGLIRHTFHHVSDDIRLLNREWWPLWHAGSMTALEWTGAVLLLGSVLFSVVTVNPRRLSLWLLLLLGVVAGFSANRNLRIAPILITPAVAAGLARLDEVLGISASPRVRLLPVLSGALLLAFAAPLLGSGARLFDFLDYTATNPGTALWVMRRNQLSGRLWTDFNWGGTVLWALPDVQVNCDGRNVSAYSEPLLRASMLFGEARDPVGVVEGYGADMVLVPRAYPSLLAFTPKYALLYCDEEACLLSRLSDQQARARAGLVLPRRKVLASELFAPPDPDALLSDPSIR